MGRGLAFNHFKAVGVSGKSVQSLGILLRFNDGHLVGSKIQVKSCQELFGVCSLRFARDNNFFSGPQGKVKGAQKIGEGLPINEVFVGRQPLGVLQDLMDAGERLPDDIITSRILWLQGEEDGLNKGGDIDSHSRYIYIHGTPEEEKIGTPASHGCVRMKNSDVIELFSLVAEGCPVNIREDINE